MSDDGDFEIGRTVPVHIDLDEHEIAGPLPVGLNPQQIRSNCIYLLAPSRG